MERFFIAFKLFLQGLGHGKDQRICRNMEFVYENSQFTATGLGTVSPKTSGSFIKAIQLQQSVLSHLD